MKTRCIALLFSLFISVIGLAQRSNSPSSSNSRESSQSTKESSQLSVAQVREYLRLSGAGEIYRAGWIGAFDSIQASKGPFWPQSFIDEAHKAMKEADLAPMVLELYRGHISHAEMKKANEFLQYHSMEELAQTEFGARICEEQRQADARNSELTLKLTDTILGPIFKEHQSELNSTRAKYIATHPDFRDF